MPAGDRRMSANPVANGGELLRDLRLPGLDATSRSRSRRPGQSEHEATRVLGAWLRDVTRDNPDDFLTFAPDELASNRLQDILDVTGRDWQIRIDERDDRLARDGRVIEVLSEHMCQGLLEGYLLSGRHGIFTCYEAFIHIVDSMFNQHAKWLEAANAVPWRQPIASLNYLLSSHVWRQDHNGNTHQDPGFLDVVMNKKPEIVRVYLPPDANTLLVDLRPLPAFPAVRERRGRGQAAPVRLARRRPGRRALRARRRHLGVGGHRRTGTASPTSCSPARATSRRSRRWPPRRSCGSACRELRVRVVNVVDLMRLLPSDEHPHGLSDREFDALFTTQAPIVFAFHGYPWLDPPAGVPPRRTTPACTCAATRRTARPRRRSTW